MANTIASPYQYRGAIVNSSVTAISYTAGSGGDLTYSSGGLQYGTGVIYDSSNNTVKAPTAAGTAAGGAVIGVVATWPAAPPSGSVLLQVGGQAKVLSSAAISLNDQVMCAGTSGKFQTATGATPELVCGVALEAATGANQLITVEFFPGGLLGKTTTF